MRRFTFWAVGLAVLMIVIFNGYGWLVLSRTSRALRQELGLRLQGIATTLSPMLVGKLDDPAGPRLLGDVMRRNDLFNVYVVNESLEYLANAREPRRVGARDPGLEPDFPEIASALAGIPTQLKVYVAGGSYLATAYVPLEDESGLAVAVLGVEADARFFSTLAGYRSSLLLISGLSLLAVIAILFVSVSLARQVLRVEQAAARANTMALMGQMAGGVAHEIKNPLGIIRASAERLQHKFDPGRAEPTFSYITEEVDRLSRVISNYLSVGAGQPGGNEDVDLAELITDVLARVEHDTSRSGIRVETDLAGLPGVTGNRIELRQVFLNLILNAIQAQPGGGEIRVFGRRDESWAVVEVADQGPGISPADRTRAFEPFFTTREKGSGLGLFVVKRVVEGHRGTVAIRSGASGGTVVEVRLPTE